MESRQSLALLVALPVMWYNALYDRAGYDLAVDYTIEPVPPLEGAAAVWVDKLLREKGLR